MALPPFDYYIPKDLKDALIVLFEENTVPFAGGTDLLINLRNIEDPPTKLTLVDIKGIKELHFIEEDEEFIRIGSTTTLHELVSNGTVRRFAPSLSMAASSMGSLQIRNRGTIAGNIVNASPCADLAPPLLIHDSIVVVESIEGERKVPLRSFLKGAYRTDLKRGELLKYFLVKKLENGGEFFYKLGRREAMNKARMNFAAFVSLNGRKRIRDLRFASGALTPNAIRFEEIEKSLIGEEPTEGAIEKASQMVRESILAITGVRWSTPYKAPVSQQLAKWVLEEAVRLAKE